MIMTETRAHNSAYLRVLSGVWYYPLSDRPDDDWWKSAYSICRDAKRGREGGRRWKKSGVDRNYEASAATSVASSGELPRLGRQLVRFRTSLPPVTALHCTRNLLPSLRATEIGLPSLSLDPLKSHFERTCLFLYFGQSSAEGSFVARTLTRLDVELRFLHPNLSGQIYIWVALFKCLTFHAAPSRRISIISERESSPLISCQR